MSYEQLSASVEALVVQNAEIATVGREAMEKASTNAVMAEKWAANPVNDPVMADKFSALHYAWLAQQTATGLEAGQQQRVDDFANELRENVGPGMVGWDDSVVYPVGTLGAHLQYSNTKADMLWLVPGDYPNLQAALNASTAIKPQYGKTVEIRIQQGFVITEGYKVQDVDLGHVMITSEAAQVTVAADFKHVETYDLPAGVARGNYFSFVHVRSVAPRWNLVVNHAACETDGGYCLYWGRGYVYPLKGVINADHNTGGSTEAGAGFKVGGASHFVAPYAAASGCGVGIAVTQSSVGDVQYADATNARFTGIDVSRGSIVYALSAKVDGARREGFYVRRSRVIAEAASIKNCPVGVRAQATAEVSCVNAVFDGCPNAVNRGSAAFVEITGATVVGVALDTQPALLFPANVNCLDSNGCTFSNTQVSGNAVVLSAINTAKAIAAGVVSAIPAAWTVVTELAGTPRDVFGGTLYGYNIGIRITVDDVVVLTTVANANGQDSGNSGFMVFAIPPFRSKNSYKIEVYNRDGVTTRGVGYNLYRSI